MSETAPKPSTSKPPDGARRVRTLTFRGGVDLPSEQQQARLSAVTVRVDKPRYEVLFVPRDGVYYVREYASWTEDDKPKPGEKPAPPKGPPVREFAIPREWALAEFEPS